jgi:hypothetical protein
VTGTECVVAIDVAHCGQLRSKSFVAFLLAWVEPDIFQNDGFAIFHCANLGVSVVADGVASEMDGRSQHLGKTNRRGCQRVFRIIAFAFGAAQVAHQNQPTATIDHAFNARQRHSNPAIVGNRQLIV